MAIEIKELIIKFSVEDRQANSALKNANSSLSKEQIKVIIDQCKEEVLEKITKLTER